MTERLAAIQRVKRALRASNRPLTEPELAAIVGLTPRQLRRALVLLRRFGDAKAEPLWHAIEPTWPAVPWRRLA